MQNLIRLCLRRLARAHLLHFLLLGLGAWYAVTGGVPAARTLVIQAGDVEQTAHEWAALQGYPATPMQHHAIVEQLVRQQLLATVARNAGLEQSPAVRERLLRLGRFLGLAPESTSDDEVIAAARNLGLDHSDRVVRRYLETAGEFMIGADLRIDPPDDAAVESWYREHRSQFTSPREVAFSHVFVGGTGNDSRARAQALLARIRQRKLSPTEAAELGDTFYGGYRYAPSTERRLAATMGEQFARAVSTLPAGRWSGPVVSAYGWHLVYIERVIAPRVQPLTAVRAQVVAVLERRRRKAAVRRYIADMRRSYNVVIADSARS